MTWDRPKAIAILKIEHERLFFSSFEIVAIIKHAFGPDSYVQHAKQCKHNVHSTHQCKCLQWKCTNVK